MSGCSGRRAVQLEIDAIEVGYLADCRSSRGKAMHGQAAETVESCGRAWEGRDAHDDACASKRQA